MPIIFLLDGSLTEVDEIDWYWLLGFSWRPTGGDCGQQTYVGAYKDRHTIYMHRLIAECMGLSCSNDIEHRDRNRRNNKRENLRPATRTQNLRNSSKRYRGTSCYKGVSYCNFTGQWKSRIQLTHGSLWLGRFDSEIEAAKAYNIAARKHFGEFANLNTFEG